MQINDHKSNWWLADIGDYLKVIANGCVMLQPIIILFLTLPFGYSQQLFLASLYNLVKFTSPTLSNMVIFTMLLHLFGNFSVAMLHLIFGTVS